MTADTEESSLAVSGTPIQEFYKDATVFITGGTGFLGKVLVEKLLHCCPDISEIVLLIRSKRDKSCYERLDDIFDDVVSSACSQNIMLSLQSVAFI